MDFNCNEWAKVFPVCIHIVLLFVLVCCDHVCYALILTNCETKNFHLP